MSSSPTKLAVYSGSFDPPGVHHRQIAAQLAEQFDEVVVFPHGPRADQPADDSLSVHRAVMADLNFRGLDRVRVDLSDLERGEFTPYSEYREIFGSSNRTVHHTVTATVCRGGGDGQSMIHQDWSDGERIWADEPFVVLLEPREPFNEVDLPPRGTRTVVPMTTSSFVLRAALFDSAPNVDDLLVPDVAAYVRRHGLFRPTPPARECVYHVREPRAKLFFDSRNPESVRIAESLGAVEHPDPNVIVVIGGDGTMLRAIRQHWRRRLPFYGLNTGHLGFLLNDKARTDFRDHDLRLYQLPLLWVEMTDQNTGGRRGGLCFNDSWVERETGQTAWLEVSVNGQVRMRKVVADGMLVATAAGSTSYARAMGATPVPFNAPLMTLAGSNVLMPQSWHPAFLSTDSVVSIRNLDPDKRPLRGFIDGETQGRVTEMTVRVSNIAAAELMFTREHDPVAKLATLQFPEPGA